MGDSFVKHTNKVFANYFPCASRMFVSISAVADYITRKGARITFTSLNLIGELVMTQEDSKTVTIIVNGTPFEVPKGRITYTQVVTLADPTFPQNPQLTFSVTFKRGPSANPEGTLSPGGSVEVKKDMVFSVSRTGQS
jgi:multiubiquitin